jgi:hypothetical protein
MAIDAILHPEDRSIVKELTDAGQLECTLEELRQTLGPILADWHGQILLGHYGAMRGLNTMTDVDCLATLGDPWPNVDQADRDIRYLGLNTTMDARLEVLCRDELEQAHGRLRTIHRQRPGRALHVGRVLPGGDGWQNGRVLRARMKVGRRGADKPMDVEELRRLIDKAGSVSAAARAVGCSRKYLRQCRDGVRPLSQKAADGLRSLGDGRPVNS